MPLGGIIMMYLFNLNGRVALPVSLFGDWVCLDCQSYSTRNRQSCQLLQATFGNYLALCIVIVMGLDLIYTLLNMQGFKKLITEMYSNVGNEPTRI